MNNPNRHMNYRRSIYRKRRIRTVIIVSAIALIVALILFLIIGNILKDKVNGNGEDSSPASSSNTDIPTPHIEPKEIRSYFSSLSNVSSRARSVYENDGDAIGVLLTDENGKLLYRSDISVKLGIQNDPPSARISEATNAAERYELYSTAIFDAKLFSEEDELIRGANIGIWSALVAEAAQNDFDEVLIILSDATEENITDILRLIDGINALAPNATIGVALPPTFFTSDSGAENVSLLWDRVEHLSVDLRAIEGEDTVASIDTALSDMNYYLIRYKIRSLIPYTDDENVNTAMIDAVEKHGVKNWQFMQ